MNGEGFKQPIVEAMKKHLSFKQIMKAATLAQRVSSKHIYDYFNKEFDLNSKKKVKNYLEKIINMMH